MFTYRNVGMKASLTGPVLRYRFLIELSNNPFIDHTASVVSRFPHIDAVSSTPNASQYSASWPQQQQQQQQQPSYQTSSGFIGTNPTGCRHPTHRPDFSLPSSFGQQFVGQASTLPTNYPQSQLQAQYTSYPSQQASYSYQQQQPPQQTGYGYQQQQQQQQQQQLISQFDPYANLGQQLSPTGTSTSLTTGGVSSPPQGLQHPRAFIQSHKVELEAWDPTTWKQIQNSLDALKTAWEGRKRAAESQVRAFGGTVGVPSTGAGGGFFGGAGAYGAYGGGYVTPQMQEIDRLNALVKEAESNVDTIAAASLQMSEVFTGYRHSGDMASKRRVRESCNAAVTSLPEYPPAVTQTGACRLCKNGSHRPTRFVPPKPQKIDLLPIDESEALY
ncbi:hypothetical protein BGW80DRAFT_1445740 [Lactifluus volemus]|nr:hypothetical protein BGW80DRAFT_1445740 [Lactifluus volemus]